MAWGMTSASDQGWAELGKGRWASARAAFEHAVATENHPLVFEGLSWAAWWLDDAAAVLAARENAYKLYMKRGDVAGAARMATWLAADQLDFHGALAVANGWLGRAKRLLETVELGPEHGWLAFHEGYRAQLAGDVVRAEALALEAVELGRRFGAGDVEMLGLALAGASLVSRARVTEGMAYLDEATALALGGEATIPISSAWVCCFLVSACVKLHDYERAFQWCDRIAEFAERYGSRYMLGFCRTEYAAVHLWRGEFREAERLLEAAADDLSHSRPPLAPMALSLLAELRRRQGRTHEAEQLLERSGASSAGQLCRARMALDRGDALTAIELCQRNLRQTPDHCLIDRAPALELLIRAYAAHGERDPAQRALATLREIAQQVGTDRLEAGVESCRGLLAMSAGDQASARACFEDAVDRLERAQAPFDCACARLDLAECLAVLKRPTDAAREAEKARSVLQELGAPAQAERAKRLQAPPDVVLMAESHSNLTRREREVLAWVARGHKNREIAHELGLSGHTIHRHVANILRKLDLPSRAAAAAHAAKLGLLPPTR